jgi:hypothetical protein
MDHLGVLIGQRSSRRRPQARVQLEAVVLRFLDRPKLAIGIAGGGAFSQTPLDISAVKILIDPSPRKAIEPLDAAHQPARINSKLVGEIRKGIRACYALRDFGAGRRMYQRIRSSILLVEN